MPQKKFRNLCQLYLMIAPAVIFAQSVHPRQSLAYTDCAGYSRSLKDVMAASNNPAVLARLEQPALGIVAERRFMLRELSSLDFMVAVPAGFGALAVKGSYFGSAVYYESELGLGLAKQLGSKLDLGIGINFSQVHMSGYKGLQSFQSLVAVLFHPSEKISIGIQLQNPWSSRLGHEKWATAFRFGMGFDISSQVCIAAEIGKQEGQDMIVRCCLIYALNGKFQARMGMLTRFPAPFGGAGWSWKSMRIDICASYHPILGFSPALLLIFAIHKTSNK